MKDIEFKKLSENNFKANSLDDFERFQKVKECWRKGNGSYVLKPVHYTEDWTLTERKELAQKILNFILSGKSAFGAFHNGKIIGFALIDSIPFGSQKQYVDLADFYVSAPYRRIGVGKELFKSACISAREFGATKLYVSAHSAKESIAAYKSYGCVFVKEINLALAKKEPYDLQLEFNLD